MVRRFTRAVRAVEMLGAVAAVGILAILFLPRLVGGGDAAPAVAEQPDLNVAVVPAADSAGFFVALHEGLFAARGLHVTFLPAVSSETVINAQALEEPGDRIDIEEWAADRPAALVYNLLDVSQVLASRRRIVVEQCIGPERGLVGVSFAE